MRKVPFIVFILLLLLLPVKTFADDNQDEVDLSVEPYNVLFDLSNTKPGDTAVREVTVQNNGAQDFYYYSEAKHTGGSKKFYRALQLQLNDSTEIIFEGSIADFQGMKPRLLAGSSEEDLTFSLEIPYELGNEYQGLETDFQLVLEASGQEMTPEDHSMSNGQSPGNNPSDGSTDGQSRSGGSLLPETATNMFSVLLIGFILILLGAVSAFVLRKKSKLREMGNDRIKM